MKKDIFAHSTHYADDLLKSTLKKFIEEELPELCYEKVAELKVSYLPSDEPLAFEEAKKGKFTSLRQGEVWAKKNFDCAWFHLEGELSKEVDRKDLYLKFSNGGEALLVDQNGHSLKGFSDGSFAFGIFTPQNLKRLYPLDELIDEQGCISCWLDGASNSLLGEFAGEVKLECAEVVRAKKDVLDVYHAFDVLYDYALRVTFENPYRERIILGLKKVVNQFAYDFPDKCASSMAILKELLSLPGQDETKVAAIGHAHVDLAWLWPLRETKRKVKRTLSSAIYLMGRYPEFHFVISQPQQLAWIKEDDPLLYSELKEFASRGQLEPIGGGWVENDTNIPDEESLVRQELYGQKFWQEEFGSYTRVRWLPDTFGYSAAIPQILKLSCQDYFMTIKISWSNRTIFPYHTFHWEGIDGSSVLVHMPPEGTYNSLAGPEALLAGEKALCETDPKDSFMVVYGVGDGGGGPSVDMVERCLIEKDIPYLPKVKMSGALEYFESLDDKDVPTYQGEMYLEKHRATYTSQSNNKNNNRRFEGMMEEFETLLASLGEQGDKKRIDALWKEGLLYQFHDILPGSSIERVYRETDAAYPAMFEEIEKMANEKGYSFDARKGHCLVNLRGNEIIDYVKLSADVYRYFKGKGALLKGKTCQGRTLEGCLDFFHSAYYDVEMDKDGSFKEIRLKGEKEPLLSNANKLRVFRDLGDSWDFQDDYRDQPERTMSLSSSCVKDYGDFLEITQKYVYLNSSLVQTIILSSLDPLIRIHHAWHWVDCGYMVRAEFDPRFWSDKATSDIQFGYLNRPTGEDTEHDAAQFEMCAQKWFDLSDEKKGVAILNNAKSGFSAKHNLISLNLIRDVAYPGRESDYVEYDYAIYPHQGGFDPIRIDDLASSFNVRHLYGEKGAEMPHFDNPSIQITCWKPAYDEDGFILRAFERSGEGANASLTLPKGYSLVSEVNLLEDPLESKKADFSFSPFQIRSWRIIKK